MLRSLSLTIATAYAFKAGQMPVAEVLYSKAIEHDSSAKALYGNRSMVRAKMGKYEEALEDGNKAVELDPTWGKGYFRRGKALFGCERFTEAFKAFEKASEIEPSNKDLKKEMAAAEAAAKKAAEEKVATPAQPEASSAPKPVKKVKKEKKAMETESDTNATATTAEIGEDEKIRGYQILADGRKTSFFHHEMTPEERALLGYDENGNLAPKTISAKEAAELEARIAEKAGDSSVWAGNTWEDRKMDNYAKERIEATVLPLTLDIPEKPGAVMKVKGIKDWAGTASIYVKLGKKRFLFDLNFKVEYEVTGLCDKTVEGEIKFTDVLPDDLSDEEVMGEHKFTGDTPSGEAHSLATKYASKPEAGLQALIIEQMCSFSKDFHQL